MSAMAASAARIARSGPSASLSPDTARPPPSSKPIFAGLPVIFADIRQIPGPFGRFFIPLRPAAIKFGWRLTATAAKSPNWPFGSAGTHCLAFIKAHLSLRRRAAFPPAGSSCWRGRRAQPSDQPQDLGEHLSRHRDLSHLESHVAPMADDLRADLDQLLLEAGERPR